MPHQQTPNDYRHHMLSIFKRGGFYQRIFEADHELDRVKQFLELFEKPAVTPTDLSKPAPRLMPLFPGINNQYFHDVTTFESARVLEREYATIRNEALSLGHEEGEAFFDYGIRDMPKDSWKVHLFSYMGDDVAENCQSCPDTAGILRRLKRRCQIYPWGDALFSVLYPGSHIPAHYSVDNLRVRCMLGLVVPPNCFMRVGNSNVHWQEGKVLLFEDSFEHEVWHKGAGRRIVLILDFWHPDLTAIEIQALTAGFSHPEIKALIYDFLGNDASGYESRIKNSLRKQCLTDVYQRYWQAA